MGQDTGKGDNFGDKVAGDLIQAIKELNKGGEDFLKFLKKKKFKEAPKSAKRKEMAKALKQSIFSVSMQIVNLRAALK